MRLSSRYIALIKKSFQDVFLKGDIYLFGSLVDDTKKGGDIDLYLIVEDPLNMFKNKIKFLAKIKQELGEQKIDVVFNIDETRLIEKEAKQWGIKL